MEIKILKENHRPKVGDIFDADFTASVVVLKMIFHCRTT